MKMLITDKMYLTPLVLPSVHIEISFYPKNNNNKMECDQVMKEHKTEHESREKSLHTHMQKKKNQKQEQRKMTNDDCSAANLLKIANHKTKTTRTITIDRQLELKATKYDCQLNLNKEGVLLAQKSKRQASQATNQPNRTEQTITEREDKKAGRIKVIFSIARNVVVIVAAIQVFIVLIIIFVVVVRILRLTSWTYWQSLLVSFF